MLVEAGSYFFSPFFYEHWMVWHWGEVHVNVSDSQKAKTSAFIEVLIDIEDFFNDFLTFSQIEKMC